MGGAARVMILLGLAGALALPARAQQTGVASSGAAVGSTASASSRTPKIAVVDVDQITRRSQSIQAAIKSAEAQVHTQDDKVQAKMKEMTDLKQNLRDQRTVLKPEDVQKQENHIRELREELDDMQYDINKKIDRLQSEVMAPEVQRVMKTVETVAQREGYDLVVRAEAVLYHTDLVDLTPQIIQELDRQSGAANKPALPEESVNPDDQKSKGQAGKNGDDQPAKGKKKR